MIILKKKKMLFIMKKNKPLIMFKSSCNISNVENNSYKMTIYNGEYYFTI